MCGIAGLVALNFKSQSDSTIRRMTKIMTHRGPDGEGFWFNKEATIHFGHRRLSIIDLSKNGAQPLSRNNYVITYNGEIYNYKELREQLIALGFLFQSESDTEVVLNSYICWGEECVNHFNGMWAFAIFDPIKNRIFCSRDRFGIKPFYYLNIDNKFVFASEIKAFTVVENWIAKVNKTRAYDFLVNGYINHTSETLFDSIFELRGGHNLVVEIEKGKVFVEQYYFLGKIEPNNTSIDDRELIYQYRRIFDSAVQLSLRSDVKVGSALSGGVDSTCLVGSMHTKIEEHNLLAEQECIAACFHEKEIDESAFVDAAANKFKLNVHKVYPDFEHFKTNFDKLIWHQEEPFPTMSIFAQYCVFEEASRHNLTVMLDGQGADEILGGYDSFYRPYFINLFKSNIFKGIAALVNYLKIHSRYPVFNIINRFFSNKTKSATYLNPGYFQSIVPFKRSQDTSVVKTTHNQLQEYGLHSLLRYEDKNAMTFSIESRVPFLDYRLVEFGISLPDNMKINNGVRKFVLRESCKDILPTEIFNRYDKFGFLTPQEVWTHANQNFFKAELNRALINCNSIFSKDLIDDYDSYIADKNFVYFIWRVICFNKWVEVFNVSLND